MNLDLSGKSILVTGASRGIGLGIAKGLAHEGARVAIHYHRNAVAANTLAQVAGKGAQAFQANLGNWEETANLVDRVLNAFGKLDVVVNNAGIALGSPMSKSDQDWSADWDLTLQTNLSATAMVCKKSLAHFVSHQEGIIINVSSRAAFRGDTEDYLAYAASKGGMVALTRSIARAYGKQGITAFNIAPGFTRTDMAQGFIDQYGEHYAKSDIALDALTTPEDIAPTVVFLASGLAKHATGATIDINAGSYVH